MSYGISEEFNYYEIELDSLDNSGPKQTGTSPLNWPVFQLNETLQNVAAIKVLECQVPFTYYVITTKNNTFILNDDVTVNAVATLEPGNYNADTLTQEFESALIAASAAANSYSVSFTGPIAKPQQNKFHIVRTNGTNFSLKFGDDGDKGFTNPRLILGMNPNFNVSVPGGVLIAPNSANITGPNYLYLNSTRLGTILTAILPNGSQDNGTIGPQISKIPVNANPGEIIFWQDPSPQFWFNLKNLSNLSDLDLYFTLGNNIQEKPLDFNGLPFSIKLGVLLLNETHTQNIGEGTEALTISSKRRRR